MENIIAKIKAKLQEPLAGTIAHEEMMPYIRTTASEARASLSPRESAVMILLFEKEQELHTLFIQRAENGGVHSGQIAFPGGKRDPDDHDLMATALRETEEEVGIAPVHIEVLGALSEVYIPPSNFLAQPYLAWIKEETSYKAQESEVQLIFSVALKDLFHEKNRGIKPIFLPKYNITVESPFFNADGKTVWGASALMLNELKHLYLSII